MNKKHLKEPGSAITHFIGMLMAILAGIPLLLKATLQPNPLYIISLSVYVISLVLLYAASTTYHSLDISDKGNKILKKFDHMMICVLIAGTYTPICLIELKDSIGIPLLILIWSFAIVGILFKAFWVTCPKWVSSILYIAMGWTCLLAFPNFLNALSTPAFGWLLTGGIVYTIGGILYALKFSIFDKLPKNFGLHEIFHLFVMGGSICHFIVMCYLF